MSKKILVTDGMDAAAVAKLRKDGYEVVEQFYEPDASVLDRKSVV